jgi:hypothetical protein
VQVAKHRFATGCGKICLLNMDDDSFDLLDRRGRLIALIIAAVIGLAVSLGILWAISATGVKQNGDALSRTMPALLGMGIFAVTSNLAFRAVIAIRKRRSAR